MMTPPYSPLFEQKDANDPIVLSDIGVDLTTMSGINKKLMGGQAVLRFLPDPRCEFIFPAPNERSSYFEILTAIMADEATWQLVFESGSAKEKFDVYASSFGENGLVLLPAISPINIINKDALPVRCVCHLLNWPRFSGRGQYALETEKDGRRSFRRLGQIIFELSTPPIFPRPNGQFRLS